ncbi:MAG: O-antigen ligase family protein [Chthoniobacterales bacterium]|nr:O-antigen ligase family protein [Chthoniobacterales bacterium]
MGDIFFNGVWRMDWGLGNPNKTAALIAMLMVAVWGLAFIRRWGFWVALSAFTVLGGCLVHTFSRGGLVAACFGLVPLLIFVPRPWPMRRLVALGVAVWAMIGFSFYLNAHERYGQGVVKQDRSITNRLHLWKHGPLMIVDSPGGWGLGNAAKSYMRWYQPIDDNESFRTFVNSHLEWLVEFNWPLRFLYLFAWAAVLLVCMPSRGNSWLAVPLGVWIAFGVASIFSSVAESPWLWILPGIVLVSALGWRIVKQQWPRPLSWAFPVGAATVGCVALLIAGGSGTQVEGSAARVVLGDGKPTFWLVADEQVLGGDRFAKTLRAAWSEHEKPPTIGVVWSVRQLPTDLSGAVVIWSGATSAEATTDSKRVLGTAERTILLVPRCYPQESGLDEDKQSVVALFGEFSQSPFLSAWEETGSVQRIAGTGDFLPNWPQLIFSENLIR